MAGKLVRAGGSVLAALTIVAVGATVGVGTAAAVSTGSAGLGSAAFPCDGCNDGGFDDFQRRGDILVRYQGPGEAVVGQEVAFTAAFEARGYASVDRLPDLAVATVTHHAPKGFTFTGAEVTAYDPDSGGYPVTALDSSVVVDPASGDVTVAAPAGGWAIPEFVSSNQGTTYYGSGNVIVKLSYKAIESVGDGASGLTYTGTGVPASDGWVAKGTTRVTQGLGGFGSSGS
ncbi:hypothetical protein FK531_01265 [Rhodococcus spelaei]|uniref:Uncharacterized protein n=1 Tax=Rhodococcus spelaei TaxID=2546320 RepID=A0A541BR07_9NOCA|nr:hypothetical protein [Rhodococcus spelaei]TQF74753.1 hypothetical protein FK531_01265 [Rhodococcus spelaei]